MTDEELLHHETNLDIFREAVYSGEPVNNSVALAAFESWSSIDVAVSRLFSDLEHELDALKHDQVIQHFIRMETRGTA